MLYAFKQGREGFGKAEDENTTELLPLLNHRI